MICGVPLTFVSLAGCGGATTPNTATGEERGEPARSVAEPTIKIARDRIPSEPLNVKIPQALVTATDAQAQFLAKVQTLSRGMSLLNTKQHLGAPSAETADSLLFYELVESQLEGGHYVTATLKFDASGLADVKIGFGHQTRTPRE